MGYLNASKIVAPSSWLMISVETIICAALLLGILTPIAGSMATFGQLIFGTALLLKPGTNAEDAIFTVIGSVVISGALTLLGPGAFSLDARLFGRRKIIIPESRGPGLP